MLDVANPNQNTIKILASLVIKSATHKRKHQGGKSNQFLKINQFLRECFMQTVVPGRIFFKIKMLRYHSPSDLSTLPVFTNRQSMGQFKRTGEYLLNNLNRYSQGTSNTEPQDLECSNFYTQVKVVFYFH